MKNAPAAHAITPAVSIESTTPPPRPAPPAEPAPSDLDSIIKADFKPATPPPETTSEPSLVEKEATAEPPKESSPKKSAKDTAFDDFLATTKEPEPDKEKPEDKPEPTPEKASNDFKTPKALRDAYESTKAEKARLAEELESLRKSQSDAKALLNQIEELKKHNAEMEDTFRAHKYEQSQEYREKFLQPMEKLYTRAVQTLSELEVEDSEKGNRPATPQDLETIVRLPTGKAIAAAKAMFGDASAIVLSYREQIKALYEQSEEAREHHKKNWSTLEEKSRVESLSRREALEALWDKTNSELSQKYADVFGESEGDDEGNQLISKGRELADRVLRDPEGMPAEHRIRIAAEIRNRAAAFGREVVRRKKAEARITELQEKLKGYESSAPDKGTPKSAKPTGPKSISSMEDALAAIGSLS